MGEEDYVSHFLAEAELINKIEFLLLQFLIYFSMALSDLYHCLGLYRTPAALAVRGTGCDSPLLSRSGWGCGYRLLFRGLLQHLKLWQPPILQLKCVILDWKCKKRRSFWHKRRNDSQGQIGHIPEKKRLQKKLKSITISWFSVGYSHQGHFWNFEEFLGFVWVRLLLLNHLIPRFFRKFELMRDSCQIEKVLIRDCCQIELELLRKCMEDYYRARVHLEISFESTFTSRRFPFPLHPAFALFFNCRFDRPRISIVYNRIDLIVVQTPSILGIATRIAADVFIAADLGHFAVNLISAISNSSNNTAGLQLLSPSI
ncbi:hypothetical protein LXL04_035499 [Taraxacum kok-saghyz]